MHKLSLEARLKAEVVSFSGKVSYYANDFKGNIISVNSSEEFEAGSCIKVFMTAKNFAKIMIIISDNIATNTLIDFLGIENINKTCQDLGFKNTVLYNKINFEKYEKLGTITPRDYAKFFEMLYKEEIWSKELSREMLSIFKNQHYNTMITKSFPQYYLDSENTGDEELIYVASKGGSMDTCRNDGGIIYTPYGSYVLVIFTKKFRDPLYYNEHEAYRYGSKVSRLILDQYLALRGTFLHRGIL